MGNMNIEIERKFLVQSDLFKGDAHKKTRMQQGYLSKDPGRTVRIRIAENQAFITIKGPSSADGKERLEWEKSIPLHDAKALMDLCLPDPLTKTRYLVNHQGFLFEVDEFHGKHQGLIVAEIELKNADQNFAKPAWLGEEVTGNPAYYNAQM